jgi:putative uncharacterized protein (fragment)
MTIAMSIVLPVMVSVGTLLGSLLRDISKTCQEQIAKSISVADEAISSIRTVKAFALESNESKLFEQEISKSAKLNTALGIGIGCFQCMSNIALNGLVLGSLVYGGYLLSNGEVSPGSLMSFLVASQTVQRSLAQLSLLIGHYVKASSSIVRIFEYIDNQPFIVSQNGQRLRLVSGDIVFKNVSFAYPSRQNQMVLSNFNLSLEPGKITALCGSSGSGKSTIASLIERFYDVNSGAVLIDDQNIKDLDLNWLRSKVIGYISQEPTLFATSIRENIRYGKEDASDEEIYEAAKIANAHQFILEFPNGYDTQVGEQGVTLSGGQRQRIAIARAVIKDPIILILDEATSALDAKSEKLVQEALDKVMQGRTVLIIAHRLTTIKNADTIVVLSKGKIMETGTHTELKKKKAFYWSLIKDFEEKL